ncbi:MAG: S41 family peptidase [Bacteriovorax sp.]|jgi:carboxyl-terminal processing protease|nr:S41 family peptidase [Bacteriovorax sp.]
MKRELRSLLLSAFLISSLPGSQATTAELSADVIKKSRYEKLELFNKVMYLIESQYYREVDTEKLIEGALNGMMNTLDPHSAFLDREIFAKMQEETSGEFGGLGIEVTQKDGLLVIITPIEDSPAFKVGIKAGDKIVEINHESMVGVTLEQAIDKLRGKTKSKIILGIAREGVEGVKNFEITREIVYLKPVKYELLEDQYAYIRLTQFQKKSADYIIDAIIKMRAEAKNKGGLKGIVLDLRSNPGGLLDEAVDVSSIFLKDGIVVSTEGRDPKNKEIRYVKKSGHKELDIPVIVLINGSTASASEIVSGALQDSKRAIIMGTQSFGKGSVQSVAKIDEQIGLKLTIAQYMTPSGKKIQAIGIKPDVYIDEVEAEFVDKNKKESSFIREKDLKNHLTATIETAEEKKLREVNELKERIERTERFKQMREKKKRGKVKEIVSEDEDYNKKIAPADDYQVIQAINYLKNVGLIKSLKF